MSSFFWVLRRGMGQLIYVNIKKQWESSTHVPTVLFRTGDSRFERTVQFLTFLAESSRFEMTLAKMSGLYEFYKMITLFTNFMWKIWPLVTKLGACAVLVYHFHHEQLIRVNKSTNCFFKKEQCTENESENQ